MKAIIKTPTSNGKNYSREKELVGAYSVIGMKDGKPHEFVTARAYMGRSSSASVVYAAIWVHCGDVQTSGHGSAGGYGYHKESAAFQDAITSAGIELYGSPYEIRAWDPNLQREKTPEEMRKEARRATKERAFIDGVGDSAMRMAFEAIARAAGAKGKLIVISH